MKTIALFLTTCMMLIMWAPVQSQTDILNRVKNKAIKKVENKLDKKVDQALDNAIDKTIDKVDDKLSKDKDKNKNEQNNSNSTHSDGDDNDDSNSSNSSNSSGNAGLNVFNNMMGGKTIPTAEVYDFNTYMEIEIENFDDENEPDGKFIQKLFTNTKNYNCAMIGSNPEDNNGEALMIMDYTNKAFLIVNYGTNDRTGIVMPFNDTIVANNEADNTTPDDYSEYNPTFRKTGNSKKILGYTCYEYVSSNAEYEHAVWVTSEYKMEQSLSFGRVQGFQQVFNYGYFPRGFTLEMFHKNLQDKTSTHMLVKDIQQTKANSFNLKGYQFMSMGGGK